MENEKAKKIIIIILLVLLLACLGVVVWQYIQINNSIEQKNEIDKNSQQQNLEINEKK